VESFGQISSAEPPSVPPGDVEAAESFKGFADSECGLAAGDEGDARGITVSAESPEVLLQLAEFVAVGWRISVAEFGVAVVQPRVQCFVLTESGLCCLPRFAACAWLAEVGADGLDPAWR
jgi:hypothetical protein